MDWISTDDFAATGSASTRWFQALSAGKTGHFGALGSRSAEAEAAARSTIAPAASAKSRFTQPRVPQTRPAGIPLAGARQRDGDLGALALAARQRDRAAVLLDERPRDREPEARARNRALRRRRRAEEAREDLRLFVHGDADAVVGDGHARVRLVGVRRDEDVPALGREFHRVRDEVVEHLPEANEIAFPRR